MILFAWHSADLVMASGWWEFLQTHWPAIIITAGVMFLVFYLVMLGRYVKLGYNIMRDTLIPLSMVSNGSKELPGQELEFRSLDGTSLRGALMRGRSLESSGQATIIFCHEFGANKNSSLRYCQGLLEAGFDVFAFDYRNHGHSSYEPSYTPRQ